MPCAAVQWLAHGSILTLLLRGCRNLLSFASLLLLQSVMELQQLERHNCQGLSGGSIHFLSNSSASCGRCTLSPQSPTLSSSVFVLSSTRLDYGSSVGGWNVHSHTPHPIYHTLCRRTQQLTQTPQSCQQTDEARSTGQTDRARSMRQTDWARSMGQPAGMAGKGTVVTVQTSTWV